MVVFSITGVLLSKTLNKDTFRMQKQTDCVIVLYTYSPMVEFKGTWHKAFLKIYLYLKLMHLFKIHLNYWVGWVRGIIFIISLWKASEPDRNFAYEFQVYRSETHLHFHIFSSLRIEFYLIPKFAFLTNIKVKSTWIGNHALWLFRRSFHNIF